MKQIAFTMLLEERHRDALLEVVYRLQRSPVWARKVHPQNVQAVEILRKCLERTRDKFEDKLRGDAA